jgi:phosphoribosylformylglycinamidine cyclo-ligase
MDYADAGVSLARADKAMEGIKNSVKSTFNSQVLGDIGNFGGLFTLNGLGIKDPVLVSSVDGVGTKLKIAFDTGWHDKPGRDIVNHCIDDILVQGAKPLFFLDYVATGKLEDGVLEEIVRGMSESCKDNNTVLIGGETAEMPGFYSEGEYDISGTIVGVAEKDQIITGESIKPGTIILGLASSGLHTNGYSLARKALFEVGGRSLLEKLQDGRSIGEALAEPHRSYLKPLWPAVQRKDIQGLVHITGSGFQGNIPRVLPKNLDVIIDRTSWDVPEIFNLIQQTGDVEKDEMYSTFNMGIGMLVFIEEAKAEVLKAEFEAAGEQVCYAGKVVAGAGKVLFQD